MKRLLDFCLFRPGSDPGNAYASRRKRGASKGQVFPIVAAMSTVLFGFAGLALDGSQDEATQMQTQGASDASGVSAARVWSNDITAKNYTGAPPFQSGCTSGPCTINTSTVEPAVFEAAQVAKLDSLTSLNLTTACVFSVGTGSSGSLHVAFFGTTPTGSNCPSVPSNFSYERLDVYIPPQNPPSICSPTYRCIEADASLYPQQNFGGFLGRETINVASSSAVYAPSSTVSTTLPCGLCTLGSSGTTINVSSNASLSVAAAIVSNSSSATAIAATSNATVTSSGSSSAIELPGGMSCTSNAVCTPSTVTNTSAISDPYSALPVPAVTGNLGAFSCGGNSSCNASPGVYTSFSASSNSHVSMSSGVYVVEGGLMSISSNAVVTGSGVMLYLTCSGYTSTNTSPCTAGTMSTSCASPSLGLSIGSNAELNITPPTSGSYKGLGVFYDRNLNTAPVCISSNASADELGTIYAKSADVSISGNAGSQSAVVADEIQLASNATLTIDETVDGGAAPLDDGSGGVSTYAQIAS